MSRLQANTFMVWWQIQDGPCSAGLEASSVVHGWGEGVWTSRWFELVRLSCFFTFDNTGCLELWWLETENKGSRHYCIQGLVTWSEREELTKCKGWMAPGHEENRNTRFQTSITGKINSSTIDRNGNIRTQWELGRENYEFFILNVEF